jgi:dTDP-4-dehydrorhamnose reductase
MGAFLVHYSTDYVYDGTKSTPYIETDAPNPLNSYGRSKLAGDQAIQQVDGAYLIFRLCWVYGLRGANFLLTMFRLARERETLRVVQDQVGSPTWSRMIAEGTAMAARQACGAPDFSAYKGLYHLNSSGQTSWHGFTSTIVEKIPASLKKCQAVEPITTAEYPTPAKRPPYSVMSSGKLKDTFGLQLPAWADSLAMAMEDYLRDR